MKLKPCNVCGYRKLDVYYHNGYNIQCIHCGNILKGSKIKMLAILKWNTLKTNHTMKRYSIYGKEF